VNRAAIAFVLLLLHQPLLADQLSLAPMFQEAAQAWGVPTAWTQAIARVESGLNPWALNIEGRGYTFASKAKALEKAQQAQQANRSFDSGVMQVNSFWLKQYGIPLEAALDPAANISLGSWILKQEIERHGQTWNAVGAYHSPDERRQRRYIELVKAALEKGPVKAVSPSRPNRAALSPATVPAIRPAADSSPLVVARQGNPINRASDAPFVQRLHKSGI
jgi:soluble lytic murein transglycosylase-like protein